MWEIIDHLSAVISRMKLAGLRQKWIDGGYQIISVPADKCTG